MLNQPGEVWDYGFGLDVTGLIVEAPTEQSLGAYLAGTVFRCATPQATAARGRTGCPFEHLPSRQVPCAALSQPAGQGCYVLHHENQHL